MSEEVPEPLFQGLNTVPAEEYEENRVEVHGKLEPYVVRDKEIEDLLTTIDFEEINRLTTEDFRKSGGALLSEEDARAHTIFPKDIICASAQGMAHIGMPPNSVMAYMPTARVIVINHELIKEIHTSFPHAPFPLVFLKILIHEENHVASSLASAEYEGDVFVIQSGMVRQAHHPEGVDPRYDFWNEAVNERRALELTRKYLERQPLSGVSRTHFKLLDPSNCKVSTSDYLIGIRLVEEIMEKIVKISKLDSEQVWLSLVHASMQGLNLDSPEIRSAIDFNVMFGPQFVKDLRELEPKLTAIQAFAKKYKLGRPQQYAEIMNRRLTERNKGSTSSSNVSGRPTLAGLPGNDTPYPKDTN